MRKIRSLRARALSGVLAALMAFAVADRANGVGDRYRTTSWASWHATHWISTSLRLSGEIWENINGRDPSLNTAVVPGAQR